MSTARRRNRSLEDDVEFSSWQLQCSAATLEVQPKICYASVYRQLPQVHSASVPSRAPSALCMLHQETRLQRRPDESPQLRLRPRHLCCWAAQRVSRRRWEQHLHKHASQLKVISVEGHQLFGNCTQALVARRIRHRSRAAAWQERPLVTCKQHHRQFQMLLVLKPPLPWRGHRGWPAAGRRCRWRRRPSLHPRLQAPGGAAAGAMTFQRQPANELQALAVDDLH